jgi:hypothetical protein
VSAGFCKAGCVGDESLSVTFLKNKKLIKWERQGTIRAIATVSRNLPLILCEGILGTKLISILFKQLHILWKMAISHFVFQK